MTTPSIEMNHTPAVQYLLRIGDTALIHGQRLAEWCGHAPIVEEDIALTNVALDHIGQARALLTRAGQLEGRGHDEDQLAFLRVERDYRNVHADVAALSEWLAVQREEDGRVSVPWAEIIVDMKLPHQLAA